MTIGSFGYCAPYDGPVRSEAAVESLAPPLQIEKNRKKPRKTMIFLVIPRKKKQEKPYFTLDYKENRGFPKDFFSKKAQKEREVF